MHCHDAILYELLQPCDVVLRIDCGFCWTRMSAYLDTVMEESNDNNHGLYRSPVF